MTGGKLKDLRKRLFGMTQDEFGKMVGRTLNTIHHWENGHRKIPESMEKHIDLLVEKELKTQTEKYGTPPPTARPRVSKK